MLQLGLRLAAPPPPGPPPSPGAAGFSVGRRIELTANHKGVSVVESHSRRADDGTAEGRRANRRVRLRVLSLSKVRASHLDALDKARDATGGGF